MKLYAIALIAACSFSRPAYCQTGIPEGASPVTRTDAISTRAAEITQKLNLPGDSDRSALQTILEVYFQTLQTLFSNRKTAMKKAEESTTEKELATARLQTAWNTAGGQLNKAYVNFLGNIARHLNEEQVEDLKDLMTEGGLQSELDRFQVLLPGLKRVHKAQITNYLKEARENAIIAENADVRSDWFIKYRGRANNYLAAAGFDLRKATEDLEARGRAIKK